jgi:hypothetical protein
VPYNTEGVIANKLHVLGEGMKEMLYVLLLHGESRVKMPSRGEPQEDRAGTAEVPQPHTPIK